MFFSSLKVYIEMFVIQLDFFDVLNENIYKTGSDS